MQLPTLSNDLKKKNEYYTDREIFATFTVPHHGSTRTAWEEMPRNLNRYLQKLRRLPTIDGLEYLRALEPHSDGFPHGHLHIRFRTVSKIRDRDKYLHDYWFKSFKENATAFGHTDFQCPRVNALGTIRYVLKYVTKGKSASRLWSLILPPSSFCAEPAKNDLGYPIKIARYASWKLISKPVNQTLFYSTFKWQKIKILTWSRGYPGTFRTV